MMTLLNKKFVYPKDLIDDNIIEFKKNKTYESINSLFHNIDTKRLGKKKLAKRIQRIFFDILLEELIYNNEIFMFPMPVFGTLRIGLYKRGSEYIYNAQTFGDNFGITLLPSKRFRLKTKRFFYVKLNKEWKKILEQEIENGHEYE